MSDDVQVLSLEEAAQHIRSLTIRVHLLELTASDHSQRFDTLQTPFWKRLWFWIDGWPWYNLNGKQAHRPWHR